MWELDLGTNVFTVDDRMVQMFEMQSHVHSMEELDVLIHEEDVQYVKDALQNTLILEDQNEIVFRTNPQSGPIRHISSRAIVGRDRKGVPVKIIGVCFDITRFARETERNLIRLNEELQRSNKDLEQFAHIASHDLQEPLRMIASFTQLLQQKYADRLDSDANEFIDYAVAGSKRMYELLNGLLAFSRVNSKGVGFTLVDMNNIFDVVLDNLKLRIEETGAQISASHLPAIIADKSQMIQILQNLLENALKFTRCKPVIHLYYTDMDNFHSFSVMDNGIGIEQQYYSKIFKIFQRLNVTEYSGTGIGLPVCKRIVERHGGKICVDSKPGEGSVFTFTILKDLSNTA
jgi:light-regulated signal transduction histidine kinase (bacteriophytochrome)